MAALRRSRRLAQILVRLKIELLFALGATEVIRLPFVLGLSSGGSRFYVHVAHRIFHSCCVLHNDLSFVREFWLDGSSNVDWRFQQLINAALSNSGIRPIIHRVPNVALLMRVARIERHDSRTKRTEDPVSLANVLTDTFSFCGGRNLFKTAQFKHAFHQFSVVEGR
jgi:hypothetical protein